DRTAPSVSSPSLSAQWDGGAVPLGIAAPSDADDAAAGRALAITVTALPGNGTVTLSGGVSVVSLGQSLTTGQLSGLQFTPGSLQVGKTGSFSYSVADLAGNAANGTATITVAASPTTSVFDFVYSYFGSKDYYLGTVADNGTFGTRIGSFASAGGAGQYTVLDQQNPTSPPQPGTVSV